MNRAYIAFGANMSNPRETLMRAIERLADAGVIIDRVSNLWRSPAWPPGSDAPEYRNGVMAVQTDLSAGSLMDLLLRIETELGRIRTIVNAPRPCDLDLIDYNGQVSEDPHCVLPHPRMAERDFVLLPMAEVADAGWKHPVSRMDMKGLLNRLAGLAGSD